MRNSTLLRKAIKKGLKILFYDIETSPMLVWTYTLFKAHIAHDQIEKDGQITSIAYKFQGDKKPKYLEWDYNEKLADDSMMLEEFSENIISNAHIVVAQNGDNFDNKVLNWRLNIHDLPPIPKLITIDTLKMSRKVFKGASQKLDYRSKVYGYGGKIKQDMQDCIEVARGNRKRQEQRIKYNLKDVDDLQKIFWKEVDAYQLPAAIIRLLRDFVKDERPFCIKCAARKESKFKVKRLKVNKKFKFKCLNCGYLWKK